MYTRKQSKTHTHTHRNTNTHTHTQWWKPMQRSEPHVALCFVNSHLCATRHLKVTQSGTLWTGGQLVTGGSWVWGHVATWGNRTGQGETWVRRLHSALTAKWWPFVMRLDGGMTDRHAFPSECCIPPEVTRLIRIISSILTPHFQRGLRAQKKPAQPTWMLN